MCVPPAIKRDQMQQTNQTEVPVTHAEWQWPVDDTNVPFIASIALDAFTGTLTRARTETFPPVKRLVLYEMLYMQMDRCASELEPPYRASLEARFFTDTYQEYRDVLAAACTNEEYPRSVAYMEEQFANADPDSDVPAAITRVNEATRPKRLSMIRAQISRLIHA